MDTNNSDHNETPKPGDTSTMPTTPVTPLAGPSVSSPSPSSVVPPSHIEPPHQDHPVGDTKPTDQPPHHHRGIPILLMILLLIFAFFGGLLIATWYFQNQLQKVSPIASVTPTPTTSPKPIVIGTDPTFKPMEFADKDGGLVGYDIDLGYRIGDELGVKTEYKNVPWDDLFNALDAKKVDMVISSVTITDERKKKYDFSEPYLNAGQVIITLKTNNSIASASALMGKKIAIQENTTNEQEALKHTDPSLVIRYPDYQQATQALVNGQADAILSDLPAAKGIIDSNPTLKIASDPFTNEYYGIVFRKVDPRVKEINKVLNTLKTQGVLTDLKQKWLD
jgi:polar amino acid transport system substrate-binding protein